MNGGPSSTQPSGPEIVAWTGVAARVHVEAIPVALPWRVTTTAWSSTPLGASVPVEKIAEGAPMTADTNEIG